MDRRESAYGVEIKYNSPNIKNEGEKIQCHNDKGI